MIPEMLVEDGTKLDLSKKKIAFGTYVLAYAGTMNTIKGRATSAIALRMSNNASGCYFTSLHTVKRIPSHWWE